MITEELSIEINRLMNDDNDRARSFLFSAAKTFYDDTLDEGYSWSSHAIKLQFDEWYEYFTRDRAALINLIIEEELFLTLNKNVDTTAINKLIIKIKGYDDAHLSMLIKNRDIINTYL